MLGALGDSGEAEDVQRRQLLIELENRQVRVVELTA
jgi:hypothetical protein